MNKLTLLALTAAFGLSSAAGFAAETAKPVASAPVAKMAPAAKKAEKHPAKIHHAKKGEKVAASAPAQKPRPPRLKRPLRPRPSTPPEAARQACEEGRFRRRPESPGRQVRSFRSGQEARR